LAKVSGFLGWTNIKHNRKIQKLSYTLGNVDRRAKFVRFGWQIYVHPKTPGTSEKIGTNLILKRR
jgi:hypothetical protein